LQIARPPSTAVIRRCSLDAYAIVVGSLDKLPGVIDALVKAVRAGELDEQLKQSSKSPRPMPSRKVA
jgi:hypothetical protein